MNTKSPVLSVLFLLFLAIVGWLVFSVFNSRTDKNYGWDRAKTDASSIAAALESYSSTYGVLPVGNVESVERILAGEDLNGKNPRKIIFLTFKPNIEYSNEWVDAWGTPYAINFLSTNCFLVSSAGKNKIFGDADDIVFNSASNDFVKP